MKRGTIKTLTLLLAVLTIAALLCACGSAGTTVSAPEASGSASSAQAPEADASTPEVSGSEQPDAPEVTPEDPAPAPEDPAPAPEKPAPAPEKPAPAPEKSAPQTPVVSDPPEPPTPVKEEGAQEVEKPDEPQSDPSPSTADAPAWEPDISFSTKDMNGRAWTDKCFADCKLTVLNYWAYWCGPCVNEMPDLQKLSQDYASRGVQFLGLYDASEEKADSALVKSVGVTYPCLRYVSAFNAYIDPVFLPTTLFVDSRGKVLGKAYVGRRSYDEWAAVIDGYLQ